MLKTKYTRREYLKVLGGLCLCSTIPKFFITPAVAQNRRNLQKVQKALPLMSTYVDITIYDESRERAYAAMEQAFNKIKELIAIFDRFDNNSHVSYLNKYKRLTEAPYELKEVLKISKKVGEITSYKFDITILPLLEEVEKEIKVHGPFLEPKRLAEITPYIGWENLKINGNKIELSAESKITLDGIAKGYIVDQAVDVLRKNNISHAIIDAGGDIRALGGKTENMAWNIGIENPDGSGSVLKTVKLKDMAIATSGNYRNFFDKSKRFFHIIDKKGAISPQYISSLSVISRSACVADGLATGLYLFPPAKVISLANNYNIPVMIITTGNNIFTSNKWDNFA